MYCEIFYKNFVFIRMFRVYNQDRVKEYEKFSLVKRGECVKEISYINVKRNEKLIQIRIGRVLF